MNVFTTRRPRRRTLQAYFGVTPPTVHQMILALERRGLITRVPGAPRSIRLRVAATELPPLEKRPIRGGTVSAARRRRAKRGPMRNAARPADPAGEYVNSFLMTQRLRNGRELSARIDGRYGVYLTTVRLTRRLDGDCTCPSDIQPCKHIWAVRVTWARNPDSFFDVRAFLRSLDAYEKAQLIAVIARIIAVFPPALDAFGVPGFAVEDADVDD